VSLDLSAGPAVGYVWIGWQSGVVEQCFRGFLVRNVRHRINAILYVTEDGGTL
jgi:hypothetical protein